MIYTEVDLILQLLGLLGQGVLWYCPAELSLNSIHFSQEEYDSNVMMGCVRLEPKVFCCSPLYFCLLFNDLGNKF